MCDNSEERARWQTSRPDYMREAEPLAHPDAWPSIEPIADTDWKEQALNRELFKAGNKRYARTVEGIRQQQKAG